MTGQVETERVTTPRWCDSCQRLVAVKWLRAMWRCEECDLPTYVTVPMSALVASARDLDAAREALEEARERLSAVLWGLTTEVGPSDPEARIKNCAEATRQALARLSSSADRSGVTDGE